MAQGKTTRVEVDTEVGESAVTHTLRFPNGHTRIVQVPYDHELYPQFLAKATKDKLLGVINTSGDSDEAVQKVDKLTDAWDEGKFSLVGEGGPKGGTLARAFAELKGISVEAAQERLSKVSKKEQAELRKLPRIAAIIERLEGPRPDIEAKFAALLADEPEDVEVKEGEADAAQR